MALEPIQYRYERKFVLTKFDYARFILMLKNTGLGFREAYPVRWINSIYFDSLSLERCYENIDGVAERTKIRMRWYGDSVGVAEESKLELKLKRGLSGTKQIYPLNGIRGDRNLNYLSASILKCALPPEVKSMMRRVSPVVMIRYQREYLVSRCERFRLTFDDKISYYSAGHGFIRGGGVRDRDCILEIKYPQEHDDEVSRISDHIPHRLKKNSKYVNALQAFYDLCF